MVAWNTTITLQSENASFKFVRNGESQRGTGQRAAARAWKVGVSGKQNKGIFPSTHLHDEIIAVFSDSQLRPLVEQKKQCPANWYVNCTPGGRFSHVSAEVRNSGITKIGQPKRVFLLVGTNDLSRHCIEDDMKSDFEGLLLCVKCKFPNAQVVVLSILPRLDEFDRRRGAYDRIMKGVSEYYGAFFVAMEKFFPKTSLALWSSRDSIHVSTSHGIPLITNVIRHITFVCPSESQMRAVPACPAWLWRQMEQNNAVRLPETSPALRVIHELRITSTKYEDLQRGSRSHRSYHEGASRLSIGNSGSNPAGIVIDGSSIVGYNWQKGWSNQPGTKGTIQQHCQITNGCKKKRKKNVKKTSEKKQLLGLVQNTKIVKARDQSRHVDMGIAFRSTNGDGQTSDESIAPQNAEVKPQMKKRGTMIRPIKTTGGGGQQIQAIIAPPHSAEERRRLIKEKEQKEQNYVRRHGNRNGGRNGGKTINRDCCDSCREGGDLLCCDRCPASFHFQCCDPPLEEDDIPTGEWICNECKAAIKQEKQPKQEGQREGSKSPEIPPSLPLLTKPELVFPQMVKMFKDRNPKEFSLPQELQDFTVLPGDRRVRGSKLTDNGKNKREEAEENMDRLCFACSKVAEPSKMAACDFCPLVFHIDCLHLPMVSPPTTIWMCPNHAEHHESRLQDPRYSVRMDQTAEIRKNVSQNSVIMDFLHCAKRDRILSNRRKKIQRRMIVPNAIKSEYKNPTILQLPDHIRHMMEPLPPYARPVTLPSRAEQDEWLKSLIALQCDIANEMTKASVPRKDPPSVKEPSVDKDPPNSANDQQPETKTERKLSTDDDQDVPKQEDASMVSLETNEKMIVDDDVEDSSIVKDPSPKEISKQAQVNETVDLPKANPDVKDKPQAISETSSSPNSQSHGLSTASATSKATISSSSPKIIILTTQSSLAGVKSSSSLAGDHVNTSSPSSSGDSSLTTGTGTRSVVIKSNSHSQTVPSSATSHFVSSITTESLQDPLLSQLDQRLVKVLAFQRIQQLLGHTKAPQTVNKKITASSIQEILTNNKPSSNSIAALCSLSGGPTVSMTLKSINIGQGADSDVLLPNYGRCNYISDKHACIFFDEEARQFELLNYSEHGTIVDNVLYSCDFSDKPNRNVTSSGAKLDSPAKFFEKGKKPPIHRTTKGYGVVNIIDPCSCRASGSSLIGGSGAGWEGTAVLHHGSFIKFGCLHFVFSIVETATTYNKPEQIPEKS